MAQVQDTVEPIERDRHSEYAAWLLTDEASEEAEQVIAVGACATAGCCPDYPEMPF